MTREENCGETKAPKKTTTRHGNKEKLKLPTKIVIRHLPPTMTEEEFLKQIDPLPAHDFYYYAAADWSLGFDATCRAYLTVKNYDDVFLFRDRFDGYVFVDGKGAEYPAIVEFAPFQGLVKNKSRRSDNKVNTIEEEAHYQQFLIKLEEEREAVSKGGECKLEFNLNIKKEEITSTPLLQYLANKKEKRRQESKKRTEEKKLQREMDREKRRVSSQARQTQQTVRIIGATKADGQTEATKREGGENNKKNTENVEEKDKLNARAKRRFERNQRRHDEYLQRKQNERAAKEGEAAKVEQTSDQKAESSEQKATDKEKIPRRERDRERERERNRARRERERQKAKAASSSAKSDERKNSGGERKMSGNSQDLPKVQSKEKCTQEKTNHNNNKFVENEYKNLQDEEEEQIRKLRAAEEKRIRNKDRPSIAIYQPKARIRLSEESDNGGNGVESEPSRERSVEKPKSEEIPIIKKVSRYSERRNERRAAAKEKEKTIAKSENENHEVSEVKTPEIIDKIE